MTSPATIAAIAAAAVAVIGAVTTLVRQLQQGKQVADHEQRITNLEPTSSIPPAKM